ncbi:hypothetical protein TRICI_001737 [Trichomonascus ciferrii]|uniref:CUE domain-containing protein n=1 Tax=Trichomonascus ciferrii TaxID=44093 RepID=A0A642V9X5_9ASCO|nr:hypothetical protein TRICI_001737 [Trichomonascus ciferrii]
MEAVAYPSFEVRNGLPSDVWARAVKLWILFLKHCPDEEFVSGYIRECARSPLPVNELSDSERELRGVVFHLVRQQQMLQHWSPELIWDFVSVYGTQNVRSVCDMVAGLPGVNMVIKKLRRVVLHLVTEGVDISEPLATLLSDRRISKEWVTDEWISQLEKSGSLKAKGISQRSLQSPGVDEISQILDLFPQISRQKAMRLMKTHGSVEQVTMHLLENPDAATGIETVEQSKPKAKPQDKNILYGKKPQPKKLEKPSASNLETTLRLIYQADEDEHDDTYDDAEAHQEDKPASSAVLDKVEKYLWELYNSKSSDAFKRESRKSKQRGEMKKRTGWSDEQIEGWAKMLERSPRRKALLEEKYMFRGNFAETDTEPDQNSSQTDDDKSESSTSNQQPQPQQQQQQANSHKAARDRKRKEQNKAKRANHNRKAAHSRKFGQ